MPMMIARTTALVGLLVTSLGCSESLAPGEHGAFRYVGNVRGAAPLALVPPISDRDGNAYVLFGDINLVSDTQLFIGLRGGGWKSDGCDITGVTGSNDFGVHGFVGRAQNRAWYWSGDALVRARARSGKCARVLELDPSSGARLSVRAAIPYVRETPSQTTMVAWIQSPTDPRPFEVRIDLENDVYTSVVELDPGNALNVEVLGVGANPTTKEGVVLARFMEGETLRVRAFFYDHEGQRVDAANITGLDLLPEYGIAGYLMANEAGLYAGVDVEGQLVVLDKSGGRRQTVSGMAPVGVHRWDGQLFVVGESNGQPRIADIDDDGDVGNANPWDASNEAGDALGSLVEVTDDRSLPSRDVEWKNPRAAMGPAFFVHKHSADLYADGTTTTLIAGPSFSAGGEDRTAIAFAPVGIAYGQ